MPDKYKFYLFHLALFFYILPDQLLYYIFKIIKQINVILNFALVPLNTKESERSLCLASDNASSELQKDKNRLLNFSSILPDILQ